MSFAGFLKAPHRVGIIQFYFYYFWETQSLACEDIFQGGAYVGGGGWGGGGSRLTHFRETKISFPIFYLIIFLNYYIVHYVNVVYASENMHAK